MPKLRGRHGLLRVAAPVVIMALAPDGRVSASGPYPQRNAIWHVAVFMRQVQHQRVWLEREGVSARRPGVRTSHGRRRRG